MAGFFGRVRNLTRGLWLTRGSSSEADSDAILEQELARARPARATRSATVPAPDPVPAEPPKGPELDEFGQIKKTL
jgi:hypothetical protein